MTTPAEHLYPIVSEAIRRAEVLEDLKAPGAQAAFLDVSLLEERIAEALPASDPEGALARRGAVRAALSAGAWARAQELVEKYLEETDADSAAREELRGLVFRGYPATVATIGVFETAIEQARELMSQLRSLEAKAARARVLWIEDGEHRRSTPALYEAGLELTALGRHVAKLSSLIERLEVEQRGADTSGQVGPRRRRKIQANSISDEGDFMAVKIEATGGLAALSGGVVGTLLAPIGGAILGSFLGGALGRDESTQLIPKSDIVEITQDSSGRVTVVVDEGPVRRREGS